jgi:hypothetical protein
MGWGEPDDVWVVDEHNGKWAVIQVRWRYGPRIRRICDTKEEAEAELKEILRYYGVTSQ